MYKDNAKAAKIGEKKKHDKFWFNSLKTTRKE